MEKTLVETFEDVLESKVNEFKDDARIKEFENASSNYEKLVAEGFAKKRGYNLLSADDAIRGKFSFNTNL